MFVNLLDLNDNDPTFQNLPFVAEVLEGTPAGVSVYQVSFPFVARDPALSHLLTSYQPASQGAVGAMRAQVAMGTLHGSGAAETGHNPLQAWRASALRDGNGRLPGGGGA